MRKKILTEIILICGKLKKTRAVVDNTHLSNFRLDSLLKKAIEIIYHLVKTG